MNNIALPSHPLDFKCMNVTYNSITLVWSPPVDDGGEPVSHYNITRTAGGVTFITTSTSITEENLTPITNNTYTISANNSYGFSSFINESCSTTGQVFNPIKKFEVCLGLWNTTHDSIAINISKDNCPPSSPNISTTPPFDNFTIAISGFESVCTKSCVFNHPISVEKEYDITITVNNQVGSSKPTTRHFDSQWIKNIHLTNDILSYSIVNCTTVKDADVVFTISDSEGCTILTDEQSYDQDYSTFNISSFMIKRSPTVAYSYTLLVTAPGTTIASTASELRLAARSMVITLFTTPLSTSSYVTRTAFLMSSEVSQDDLTLSLAVVAGISVAITVPVTAVITVLVTVVILYLCGCLRIVKPSGKILQGYETTSVLEMKSNTAYGQVKHTTPATMPTVYETVKT